MHKKVDHLGFESFEKRPKHFISAYEVVLDEVSRLPPNWNDRKSIERWAVRCIARYIEVLGESLIADARFALTRLHRVDDS